jgi:hypothetical protein
MSALEFRNDKIDKSLKHAKFVQNSSKDANVINLLRNELIN